MDTIQLNKVTFWSNTESSVLRARQKTNKLPNHISLISNRKWLEAWCKVNNLFINVKETKKMIVDFSTTPLALYIGEAAVEMVSCFETSAVHITDNLTLSISTGSTVKKAHQHLYVFEEAEEHWPWLFCAESLLTCRVAVWYYHADSHRLVVKTV